MAVSSQLRSRDEKETTLKLPNIFEKGRTPVVARTGETIFTDGQPADFMYAVKRGEVEICLFA